MKFYLCLQTSSFEWEAMVLCGPIQTSAQPMKLFHPDFEVSEMIVQPELSLVTMVEFREENVSSIN